MHTCVPVFWRRKLRRTTLIDVQVLDASKSRQFCNLLMIVLVVLVASIFFG
jgi:hypothetical protein